MFKPIYIKSEHRHRQDKEEEETGGCGHQRRRKA